MYYNFNYYISKFKLVCIIILIIYHLIYFLKFVVREINSKIVKSRIEVLTRREKSDMAID
jgi:hypothetical protein